MDDIKQQIHKLQTEIHESRSLLHQGEHEDISRQELKETTECKEKQPAELQHKMDEADGLTLPRRSERPSVPTERIITYQKEVQSKKEKKLLSQYEHSKIQIRKSKENLKKDISETELATMADTIEKGKDDLMRAYNEIRERATPSTELRRKVDACKAVTKDILKIVYECLAAIDGEFDAEHEKYRLRQLQAHDYAHSIYGTASQSGASHRSESTITAAKRAEAAAELAAKEA